MPNSKEILIQELDALANAINTKANSTGEKSIPAMTSTVNAIATEKPEQVKSVGLSMAQGAQVIQPDEGKVLTQVTVEKPDTLIAGNIKQGITIGAVAGNFTADANAAAGDILSSKTAYVNGQKVTGEIALQAAQTITPTTSDQTIAAGKYLSGAQTIKGDANLIAANIAKDITIFGVTGTLEAGGELPQGSGFYYYDAYDEHFTNVSELASESGGLGFFDSQNNYAIPNIVPGVYSFGCNGASDYQYIPLELQSDAISNLAVNDSITIYGDDDKEYTLTRTV